MVWPPLLSRSCLRTCNITIPTACHLPLVASIDRYPRYTTRPPFHRMYIKYTRSAKEHPGIYDCVYSFYGRYFPQRDVQFNLLRYPVVQCLHSCTPLLAYNCRSPPRIYPDQIAVYIYFLVSISLSIFWTSCGLRCRPFCPPGKCFQFLSRFSIPAARRLSSSVANLRFRAFRESICAQKKLPTNLYEYMHSGGLEATS